MTTRALPISLAVSATVTAACLSIQSGLQRGGLPAERHLLVAVGVVLVVAAHLLPAICRPHGAGVRTVGALLWIACLAATCYGHAVFFLMAQKHAGELRAAAVPLVTVSGRDLGAIERDRATAVTRLARATERRCNEPCPALRVERATAAAKLDAIDAERAEAQRAEAAQDRARAARDAALTDPVTGAMSAFGVPVARAELVAGLAFAAALEAVACFSWALALRPAAVTEIAVTPAQQGSNAVVATAVTVAPVAPEVAPPEPMLSLPVMEQAEKESREDRIRRYVATAKPEIESGALRATVNAIRIRFDCAQSIAVEVRRQLEPQPIE